MEFLTRLLLAVLVSLFVEGLSKPVGDRQRTNALRDIKDHHKQDRDRGHPIDHYSIIDKKEIHPRVGLSDDGNDLLNFGIGHARDVGRIRDRRGMRREPQSFYHDAHRAAKEEKDTREHQYLTFCRMLLEEARLGHVVERGFLSLCRRMTEVKNSPPDYPHNKNPKKHHKPKLESSRGGQDKVGPPVDQEMDDDQGSGSGAAETTGAKEHEDDFEKKYVMSSPSYASSSAWSVSSLPESEY